MNTFHFILWTTTAFCNFADSIVSDSLVSSLLGNVVCKTKFAPSYWQRDLKQNVKETNTDRNCGGVFLSTTYSVFTSLILARETLEMHSWLEWPLQFYKHEHCFFAKAILYVTHCSKAMNTEYLPKWAGYQSSIKVDPSSAQKIKGYEVMCLLISLIVCERLNFCTNLK